jgi:transcriptional regulator with XRE-family HTH domain
MTAPKPRPRPYVLRDNEHAMSTLGLIRAERGMSLRRLGSLVIATRQQVAEWLRGYHVPASQRLFDLAHALGYDLALIPREDTP